MLRVLGLFFIIVLSIIIIAIKLQKRIDKTIKDKVHHKKNNDQDEVIYSDDEVIVLKGESRKKKDN